MGNKVYMYIIVMAVVTYLIRVLPLTLIRGEIRNRYLRSFLYYVPYVTLAVMTFPAILSAAPGVWPALAGFLIAVALAYRGASLFQVAMSACVAVFIVNAVGGLILKL
jgi:branched-subunit amino acid transport protein